MKSEEIAALFMDVVPQAMREYRKQMRDSRTVAISVPQFRILAHIFLKPSSNRRLAEDLGVSVAAMSRMIDSLARMGLVERLECSEDRRQVRVQLTAHGRSSFEDLRTAARLRLSQRFSGLDKKQQLSINNGLLALANAFEALGESAEA